MSAPLPAVPEIDALLRERPVVLVFLPNTNELQRFVWSDAFEGLRQCYDLHYVLPEGDADAMRRAAPAITEAGSTAIAVPAERFALWVKVFEAGCVHYARLSPSFAIRAGLDPDPACGATLSATERDALDREFDASVARMLDPHEPLPAIVDVLERRRPLFCLVPTSLLDVFCNEVVWACERAEVGCVLLQSGWDNLSSKGLVHSRNALLGCWGPQSRQHARAIQRFSRKLIVPLGAPHYESLRPAGEADVRALRQQLGVASDERLVLFGGSFRQFDETGTLEVLDREIAAGRLGRIRIVYRPHPWRAARQHEESFFSREWTHVVFDPDMRERYLREQAEPGYIKRNVPMFDMAYLARLISASDAVISPMSTLLLEALILRKPTMAIAFGDGKHRHNPSVTAQMSHFRELRQSAAIIWCDSSDRLVEDCSRLLEPGTAGGVAGARRALLKDVVTTEPGTYAERLTNFCRSVVEPYARKLRAHRTAMQRDTISHAYGAHLIAREYCGVANRDLAVPGYWMHGWIPAYHNVHPALIALHKKHGQHDDYDFDAQIREEKEDTVQWVSRADQAEYLIAHGYRHVRAIGLPVVYLPDAGVRRVPGSLLVLPPHSHKNHGPDDPLAEQYAEMIAALKPRFSHIAVGVNEDDIAKNQWVQSFRRRGIDVFTTTDQANPRTLVRLHRILSTFEYVTTNGFGSHIALAAYCGAKVSVYGPFAEFPFDRMKATHAVKMFPELLDEAYYLCTEAALRKHYPFLFVEPHAAADLRAWGRQEVGEPCRVPPADLRRLFGWDAADTTPGPAHAPRAAVPGRESAVSTTGAPPVASFGNPGSPLVLFGMAHAGFVRNFEHVIAGLLQAGVNVHLHFSKAHHSIAMSDYELSAPGVAGRLTHSTSDPAAADVSMPVERLRLVRDLILYSGATYESATDLRARFAELQKSGVMRETAQRRVSALLRRLPIAARNALDSLLKWRDERTAPSRAASDIVDALRPDCVMVAPLVNFGSREVDLVKAARWRGIPTLLPVASWDNLTNKGRIKIAPDVVAVWNEAMATEAVELHGIGRERIRITGAPVFDAWFDRLPSRGRDAFCQALGFDASRPLVVYLCSSISIAGAAERNLVKDWLQAVQKAGSPLSDANILVRPHPMATAGWTKVTEPDGRGGGTWRGVPVWPLDAKHPTTAQTRADFFDTLFHADAIVGLNTSAMIEAAILGKPVLTFLGHEQAVSQTGNLHFRHLAEGGFVFTAADLTAHVEQLERVISGDIDVTSGCGQFVRRFVRPLGRQMPASDALVDLVLSALHITAARDVDSVAAAARSLA